METTMTEVKHRIVETNGIRMHVAEQGAGPLVVLCHGFPESWYSWRHQFEALAEAGSTWSRPTCVDAIASYRWEEMQATLELHLPNYATAILSAADTIAALEHTTV
jgi:pimeloyl-ACP methyl ester carboxylesterase